MMIKVIGAYFGDVIFEGELDDCRNYCNQMLLKRSKSDQEQFQLDLDEGMIYVYNARNCCTLNYINPCGF